MISCIEKLIAEKAPPNARRCAMGVALSIIGVLFNVLLFCTKRYAGRRSGSVAVTADAFNNLFDAGGWVLTMMGFILAVVPPSRRFPYGCGRIEYLSGAVISASVLSIGARLFYSSVEKTIHPVPIESRRVTVMVMLLSLLIKGYMFLYTRRCGAKLDSAPVKAASVDSLCDCIATTDVLISVVINYLSGMNIDGICGILVAVCILWAGIGSMKKSIFPLIGHREDEKTEDMIRELLWDRYRLAVDHIALHDYGASAKTADIVTAQAPVDTDAVKRMLKKEAQINAVIEIRSPAPFGDAENKTPKTGQE